MEWRAKEGWRKSMFSDEEFETMEEIFKEQNPNLEGDHIELRNRWQKLVDELEKIPKAKDQDHQAAVSILLQGINFLSRLMGRPEIEVVGMENAENVSSPEKEKSVAIFTGYFDESFILKLEKTLNNIINPEVKFDFYKKIDSLLEDIKERKIRGIVFLSPLEQKEYVLKNTLRDDLKKQMGWGYKKIQEYSLPPIINLYHPFFITEITQAINSLSRQKNQTLPKTGEFFLKKAIPSLRDRMYKPEEEIWVAIVGDTPAEMTGIKKILESWPNVNYGYFMESSMTHAIDEIILLKAKVILFDGGIWTKLDEEEILNLLQEKRFDGIFATINDGDHPRWSRWHFPSKHKIENSLSVSKKFVSFMNDLLKRIG